MTSKNLFLADIRENLKRRNWVTAIFGLFFFFYFPLATVLGISSTRSIGYTEGTAETKNILFHNFFASQTGVNGAGFFFFSVLAFLCALQAFSYLHDRKKVDMYHALPVSSTRRFLTIYINGILLFMVSYLIGVLLSCGVFLAMTGPLKAGTLLWIVTAFLKYLLLYLCIYNGTILAVVLTGKSILSFFAALLILFYQNTCTMLIIGYSQAFFRTASFSSVSFNKSMTGLFEPVTTFFAWAGWIQPDMHSSFLMPLYLICFALVTGAASYLLYRIRPGDASGKAIAFRRLRPLIKVLIVIPTALCTGLFFYSMVNELAVAGVIGILLGLILTHCIIEIIYEFDIKAALHHRKQLLLCGVLSYLVFGIFAFDLIGYDRYIPDASKLESVSLDMGDFSMHYYSKEDLAAFSSGEQDSISWSYDVLSDTMHLTDLNSVLALVQNAVTEENSAEDSITYNCTVTYHFKNGQSKAKTIWVDFEKNQELLNRLFLSDEYKHALVQIYDDGLFQALPNVQAAFVNILDTTFDLDGLSADMVRETYLKDFDALTFSQYCNEIPCGTLLFSSAPKNRNPLQVYNSYDSTVQWSYPVYPSFSNTLALLKGQGIDASSKLDSGKISSITFMDNSDGNEHTFSDPAEVRAITEILLPVIDSFSQHFNSIYGYFEFTIRFQDGTSYNSYFSVSDIDSLPDILQEIIE